MDTDPTSNVVLFELRARAPDHVCGAAPAIAEDSVRQAWDTARHEHRLRAEDVVALGRVPARLPRGAVGAGRR